MYIYIYTYIEREIHIYIYIYIYRHTHTNTYMYTHIYIYFQTTGSGPALCSSKVSQIPYLFAMCCLSGHMLSQIPCLLPPRVAMNIDYGKSQHFCDDPRLS